MTVTVFRTTYRLCLGLVLIGRFLHHTKSELPPTTNLALESRKTHHAALPPLCRPRTGSASKMDVGLVRSRIVATLDADADARRRAELDLKAVRTIFTPLSPHISLTLFSPGRGTRRLHRCTTRYPTRRTGGLRQTVEYVFLPLPRHPPVSYPRPNCCNNPLTHISGHIPKKPCVACLGRQRRCGRHS